LWDLFTPVQQPVFGSSFSSFLDGPTYKTTF
jgi:hypothetical protein